MVIERGQSWGDVTVTPPGLTVVADDAALGDLLTSTDPVDRPPLAVAAGDLHRTLGAPTVPVVGERCRKLPVDVMRCELDDGARLVVAHVVVRRPGRLGWWRGPVLAVCNAQFHRRWDVAPRGHPNDGRVDVLEAAAAMPVRQRLLAERRLRTGTHLPHPDLRATRVGHIDRTIGRGQVVHLDGVAVRGVGMLRIEVVPDAFELHVAAG